MYPGIRSRWILPQEPYREWFCLAATAAAVTAATIVIVVATKPVAAAAAHQDENDNEPRAVSVTHIGKPPFELHSILWWEKKSVTTSGLAF